MMQLTQEQKDAVKKWVGAGDSLSEIQKKIRDEFKIPVTFIDVRFLVLDLGLSIKEKTDATSRSVDLSKPPAAPAPAEAALEDEDAAPAPGGVTVELDRVMKPGALASGSARFSDGQTAQWSLDQFGRLGLSAAKPGYRPSQEDLQAFQQELARILQSRGF